MKNGKLLLDEELEDVVGGGNPAKDLEVVTDKMEFDANGKPLCHCHAPLEFMEDRYLTIIFACSVHGYDHGSYITNRARTVWTWNKNPQVIGR